MCTAGSVFACSTELHLCISLETQEEAHCDWSIETWLTKRSFQILHKAMVRAHQHRVQQWLWPHTSLNQTTTYTVHGVLSCSLVSPTGRLASDFACSGRYRPIRQQDFFKSKITVVATHYCILYRLFSRGMEECCFVNWFCQLLDICDILVPTGSACWFEDILAFH